MQHTMAVSFKRPGRIIPILVLLLAAAEAVLFFYFEVYLKQIEDIEDVSIKVRQYSNFKLPQTVEVLLRNGEYEKVTVRWDRSYVETDVTGDIHVSGGVEGYTGKVNLDISVYKYVSSVERPRRVMLVEEGKNADSVLKVLPQSLEVEYSTGSSGNEKVQWNTRMVDVGKPGLYEVTGRLEGSIQCEQEITCSLEVIAREEALRRIIFADESLMDASVKRTMDAVRQLPDDVLEPLIEGDMMIRFVARNITDMPEFSSLKEKESGTMKITGVFKYPQIVVDRQAEKYVNTGEKDDFYTITLHEIGHAYDYLYGGEENRNSFALSSKPEFTSIWKNEASKLFRPQVTNMSQELNNYYIDAEYEYFAECFCYYFAGNEYKERLKKYAPETYDFIRGCTD
ncbi:MAG: Ig-like domain-containing protein [Bacillota bacterium]|nr:Ig-like domain-containing protein [Bacillota bacterium]